MLLGGGEACDGRSWGGGYCTVHTRPSVLAVGSCVLGYWRLLGWSGVELGGGGKVEKKGELKERVTEGEGSWLKVDASRLGWV